LDERGSQTTRWNDAARQRAEPGRPAYNRNRDSPRAADAGFAEFLARLAELTQSSNESVRLAAIKECLDRLIGRSPIFIDSVTTKLGIPGLYLKALQQANAKTVDGSTQNGAAQTIVGEAEPK
jgi:hypothetical protein